MRTFKLFLCVAMVMPSFVLIAQSKGDMPFTSSSKKTTKLIRMGWSELSDAKMEEGNNYIRQALQEDPECGMAYASLWTPDEAERDANIRKAADAKLSADEKQFIEGLKIRSDQAQAEKHFRPLVEKYPNDEYLHLLVMFTLHGQDAAVEIGENLIKRNPKLAPVYNLLGYEYMARQDMAKAEAHFDKYISLRPDLANPYDSKADYLARLGKYEEASALYQKAADLGMTVSSSRAEAARLRAKYPAPSEAEATNIKTMVMETFEALEKSDVDGLVKDFSDQAIEVWSNQRVNVGLPNIRIRLSNMFNNWSYPDASVDVKSILGTGPIAIARSANQFTRKSSATNEVSELKNHTISILRKHTDGKWKFLVSHFFESDEDVNSLSDEDRKSVTSLLHSWDMSFPKGEVTTPKHFEMFSSLYSKQAIEILPNQISNIGIANLEARWHQFTGLTMEKNTLGTIGIEGMGRKAVAWGIGEQRFYANDSQELTEFLFPWAMILTKEKDDVWRILAFHWAN